MDREKFKLDAKNYIQEIYASHREQDQEAWAQLIDIIFLYIDEMIAHYHPENKNE
jgi:hypothetical protein